MDVSKVTTEAEAVSIIQRLGDKFDMAVTMWVRGDAESAVETHTKFEGATDAEKESAVEWLLESRAWSRTLDERMCEVGWDVLDNALYDFEQDSEDE